jgi:hypothetical protein
MTGYQSKRAAAQDKLTVDREQLKQWLEALKDIDALHHSQEPESVDAQKAIADMGQALAQPAQEPVAWVNKERNTITWDKLYPDMDALYTHPPQRPWVGLTAEEKQECVNQSIYYTAWSSDVDLDTLIDVVQQKLKDLNK